MISERRADLCVSDQGPRICPTTFSTPSEWLRTFQLAVPVVSCSEAASAKGIPLRRELKSLLIRIDNACLALAHVPGDRRLSMRRVKQVLHTKQARLCDAEELRSVGVEAGTVHPFHPQLWPLQQIVSQELLSLSWVSTNAGSTTKYVVFDPLVLTRAPSFLVVDIEEA